ncbi:hypothetical protein VKT23_009621 [Stygiomarasmius scandens]|uniref:DUF6534 domain-containing protein n=1 Tax=Marasmiellus scandens TaxID=2682957 RepID=A0ABR1IZD1_9AGAR
MAILSKTFGVLLIALFFLLIFYGMVIVNLFNPLRWSNKTSHKTSRTDPGRSISSNLPLRQSADSWHGDPSLVSHIYASPLPLYRNLDAHRVIGTVQAVTAFTWVYDDLINRFGKVFELDILPPYALVQLMSMVLSAGLYLAMLFRNASLDMYVLSFTSLTIQLSYPNRLPVSKRNMYITVPIFISAFVVLVTGIITAVRVGQLGRFSLIIRVKTIVIIQDAAVLLCDFLITTSLSILLHTHRSGIKSTDSLITRIVVACINRGILLFMLAVCSLVLFLTQTRTMLFLLSLLPAGQLYIITVLSMLVSRKSMRSGHSAEIHSLSHLSNSNETYHSNAPRAIAMTASQIGNHGEAKIQVTQSVLTSWDERGKNAEPSDDVSEPEP